MMTRIDNGLQWPFMAQNPQPDLLELSQTPQIWQNTNRYPHPPLQNPFYQNPSLPENLQPHPYNFGGLESGLLLNPNMSLEDALRRINLSGTAPSHHYHPQSQSLEGNSGFNSGFYSDLYSSQQPLNRMRSMSAGLGLLHANSNMLSDPQYQNGGRNMSSFRDNINRTNSRRSRRIQGDDRLVFLPSVMLNAYGFGAGPVRPFNGLDGLESAANSNIFLPSMKNGSGGSAGGGAKRSNYYSTMGLEQVKGRMYIVSKDQEGSRFLQKKIDEQIPDHIEMIFLELKDHVCDLIIDQFAHGVIQKLFGICSEEQMTQLLLSLIKNCQILLNICIHQHGTRAMQKMIERIRTPDQRFALVSALKHITVCLCKDSNGHHVIEQCYKFFAVDDTKCLLDEIANSCLEIAMDKSGCCVLQKSLNRAQGQLKDRLIADITANALLLSEHPYGNYVLQYVLEMKVPHAENSIVERLRQNFVSLSMNKYGSNVVEKCITYCCENNAARVIQELIRSQDFLDVVQDPFGNYVVQTALNVYKGKILYDLALVIDCYYPYLHSHLHGKKVLALLARKRSGNRNNRI